MAKKGCIYGEFCTVTKLWYIGSTMKQPRSERDKEHRESLNNSPEDCNPRLLADWRRYGPEKFRFVVLQDDIPAKDLLKCEDRWIEWLGGYNFVDANGRARNSGDELVFMRKYNLERDHACAVRFTNAGEPLIEEVNGFILQCVTLTRRHKRMLRQVKYELWIEKKFKRDFPEHYKLITYLRRDLRRTAGLPEWVNFSVHSPDPDGHQWRMRQKYTFAEEYKGRRR